jgi:predicted permease
LVVAWKRTATGTFSHYPFGADAIKHVKDYARSFAGVGAFSYNGAMEFPAIEDDVAGYLTTAVVDGDFFPVLAVEPLLGRTLTANDDAAGAERVLVIDERLWAQRYGRAGDVLGRRLRLFDETFTIVGVVPAVDLPRGTQAWVTFQGGDASPSSKEVLRRDQDFVARLRSGVTIAQATTELDALTEDYERNAGKSVVPSVKPYTEEVVGDARTPVMLLFGATLLILLIACANVGNLVLLRGEGRRTQFALRAALGAGRAHLARQVGAEALVLCGLGGAAGLLLAYWSLDVVVALSPPELPRVEFLRIDGRVVLFSLASTLLAAAAASIVSTLVSTRLTGAILSSGSSRLASTAFPQSRRALVVTQVALSVTIVAGAGVLTRTLLRLQSADMGFAASRMSFVELFLPPGRYEDVKVRRPFLEELSARVRSIPGVEDVVPIAVSPYAGLSGWDMPNWVAEGQGPADAGRNPGLDLQSVYPGHFEVMGIPVLEGRGIDRFDRENGLRVAVISENAARQVWPGRQSAIGKRVKWGSVGSDGPWFTVVGVAATTRYRELAAPRASLYLPAAQFVDGATSLAVRSSLPLPAIAGPLRDRVRELDRNVFVLRTQSFDGYVARPLARPRLLAVLANIFAAVALLLATVGLYGVLAAFVRQSTREIGVRMALGARARHVRALVLGEAIRLAAIGFALGLAGAFASGRVLRGMLFGVAPMDPSTLAAAAAILVFTIVAACYFPIRRAARIDPGILLRDA